MRLALLLLALPLAACGGLADRHGGNRAMAGEARNFDIADFTRVELQGPDEVDVRVGPGFAVRAEGDSRVLDRLDLRKRGDVLLIGRKPGIGWNWGEAKGVKIHIVLPRLRSVLVTGSGDMSVDRIESNFAGDVAGSGNLAIREVRAPKLALSVTGSGDLKASGTAKSANLSVVGSGDLDASGLEAEGAGISISGSGEARARVTGDAAISIVGSGDAVVTGGARCIVSRTGSGDAHCS